jgi:hypothetical protein
MHLTHLQRSSKQRYMQLSPVLTTVGARTCTTWRCVYCIGSDSKTALLALYTHIQFHLNYYTSAGYLCKISLITTGLDCFGCQITVPLRAIRRLIGWRELARTPNYVYRSLVFHYQLQLSGIWIESGSLTHILNTGSHSTAVDNPSFRSRFRLNIQSCKQPNTAWVCLKKKIKIPVSLITGNCCLNKHLHRMGLTTSSVCASCQLEEETALHFVCVCPTLATLRTRMRTPVILLFAFQNGRLESRDTPLTQLF